MAEARPGADLGSVRSEVLISVKSSGRLMWVEARRGVLEAKASRPVRQKPSESEGTTKRSKSG